MPNYNSQQTRTNGRNDYNLNLDGILSSQPELGPSIPDGGYGWVVFLGTLFFQALIPNLVVNFGIFLAFSKLEWGTADNLDPKIWDDKLLYVPLFYMISHTFFDTSIRSLISSSTWPRLVATGGTCLTSAGLLLMWMGMTGRNDDWLFVPAGILSGLGASLLMVQSEVLLSQYFRQKLILLHQTSHAIRIVGFILGPFILGHHILSSNLYHILLWYQAIILQGLVISLIFKKPHYLKSSAKTYHSAIATSNNDEEDIFSKNSRELQIKRQTTTGSQVSKIPIDPGPSTSATKWEAFQDEGAEGSTKKGDDWEKFEDEEIKYAKIEDQTGVENKNWVKFEEEGTPDLINDLSLAEEMRQKEETNNTRPSPLFTDSPVNNNNTYAYDDNFVEEFPNSTVFTFPPTVNQQTQQRLKRTIEFLKEPTFYKSLLMVVTNKFSNFIFYVLFPSYLFVEVKSESMRHMSSLIGLLSLANLIFLPFAYWVNVSKSRRPLCIWLCCWLGCGGYFMISDYRSEIVLLNGAIFAILSMCSLEHVGKPLIGVTIRGEIIRGDYVLFTLFSAIAFLIFLFINVSFKDCFRMMAILNFFTGSLWLANYAYKKLRPNRS